MSRRGLFVGIRLGPLSIGGRVGGRKPKRHYQPGAHPMMQPTVRDAFREMRRRKTGR
jgi:hypothetical protein